MTDRTAEQEAPKCGRCRSTALKSVTTNAGMVHACETCSHHWFVPYALDPREELRQQLVAFTLHQLVAELARRYPLV